MNKLRKLRELSSSTKRLVLLTIVTMALAMPAAAIRESCQVWDVVCPNGQETGADVCCVTGEQSYAECSCNEWSAPDGWSECGLVTVCY